MNKISKIINLKKHPINDLKNFAHKCKKEIQKNSILVLRDFLNSSALEHLQKESKTLHQKAFYCSQKHTVLLNKKGTKELKRINPEAYKILVMDRRDHYHFFPTKGIRKVLIYTID